MKIGHIVHTSASITRAREVQDRRSGHAKAIDRSLKAPKAPYDLRLILNKTYQKFIKPNTKHSYLKSSDMVQTFNEFAWKYVEPIFHAKKQAWVCSPWISKSYCEKLYDLSRRGVEVRIITSDDFYNADTYSYLSQLSQTTNFDVHFIKKELVHSKIYIVDKKYAVTGAFNFTYTGLNKQTNNFTIVENEEVEPIANIFRGLWIDFKSENVQPTESKVKNVLPIMPYEKAVVPEIRNSNVLKTTFAKLIIKPYFKISYSLIENVRLPWYQQTVIEDKGIVVIDANSANLLNYNKPLNHASNVIIRDLNRIVPLEELVITSSDDYKFENLEWDVKVDNYKAEALAINYIKEKNRRNIQYNDRYEGQKYQSYSPSNRAITILSNAFILVPTWHFKYDFNGNSFESVLLASSGEILSSSFHKDGAICQDCGKSILGNSAIRCPSCNKWVCPSETIVCSSCQKILHKEHSHRTCQICKQFLCDNCSAVCPVCNREYGKDHSVTCMDCGIKICSSCIITSGLIMKKKRCLECNVESKKK